MDFVVVGRCASGKCTYLRRICHQTTRMLCLDADIVPACSEEVVSLPGEVQPPPNAWVVRISNARYGILPGGRTVVLERDDGDCADDGGEKARKGNAAVVVKSLRLTRYLVWPVLLARRRVKASAEDARALRAMLCGGGDGPAPETLRTLWDDDVRRHMQDSDAADPLPFKDVPQLVSIAARCFDVGVDYRTDIRFGQQWMRFQGPLMGKTLASDALQAARRGAVARAVKVKTVDDALRVIVGNDAPQLVVVRAECCVSEFCSALIARVSGSEKRDTVRFTGKRVFNVRATGCYKRPLFGGGPSGGAGCEWLVVVDSVPPDAGCRGRKGTVVVCPSKSRLPVLLHGPCDRTVVIKIAKNACAKWLSYARKHPEEHVCCEAPLVERCSSGIRIHPRGRCRCYCVPKNVTESEKKIPPAVADAVVLSPASSVSAGSQWPRVVVVGVRTAISDVCDMLCNASFKLCDMVDVDV